MALSNYILLVIAVLYFVRKWLIREKLQKLTHFHAVPSLPLVGSVKYVSSNMRERTSTIINLFKHFPMPAVGWIFHIPLVIVGTGADIQAVLNQASDKGLYEKLKNFFRNGILVKSGVKWRKSRRTVDPIFSATMMQHYLQVFNHHAVKLIQKMEPKANTHETFDIWLCVAYMNVDIIFQNMADYQSKVQEKEDEHLIQLIERGAELDSMRCTQPLLYLDFMNNAYLYITGQWKVFAEIDVFFSNIVRTRMEYNKSNESHRNDDSQETERKNRTLLDALIKLHQTDPEYTFECVRDDFLNVILAGSATVARTTCFALLMLAIHQDIQEKLYQEIKAVFGNSTRPVEMDDLNRLIYLEQCVKETLRKYPVVPIFFRQHSKDIVLNEKRTIPAFTDIIIATYVLHHNEQQFPNSDVWDPDRFAPEVVSGSDKLGFLPFGIGPHSCIGAKYAMISLKTQLVHLLRSYRFETDMKHEDIELYMDVILKSANGYQLKLWPRECENLADHSSAST